MRPGVNRRILALAIILTLLALGSLTAWGTHQGYVSLTGESCTLEGIEPVPSFDDLVHKYGKTPYCARLMRDETWG